VTVRAFCLVVFCAALCLRVVAYATADTADPDYIGSWKFTAVVRAPWTAPDRKSDAAERARLLGKTIVFKPTAIDGPSPFVCTGAHYKLTNDTASLLFRGEVEKLRHQGQTVDPARIASALGFNDDTVRTLETGCAFDFHFVNASTARVGVDDLVYTLKKQ
jgi:hypothetical protein